jgi:hypothetical protein
MPYLYENPILNIGVYYDKESMADDPSIHSFDNGIAEYNASTMRDHFCTAEKTAAMFGKRRDMKMCVKIKVPYDEEKFKADPSDPWKYGGYYEVWRDLVNYNDITDHPEEAPKWPQKKWRVVVEQRSVFYEEADTEQEARRIVAEDRVWDEMLEERDTYDFEITVEEDDE